MQIKTVIVTVIMIASTMGMAGCTGEDSSDSSCQVIEKGEYRLVDEDGVTAAYYRVGESSQAESPDYDQQDVGTCLLNMEALIPKTVSENITGFYLYVGAHQDNPTDADAFTMPLMVKGNKESPVLIDYSCSACGSDNEVRVYYNRSGTLLDSGDIVFPKLEGTDEQYLASWELCENCFETEMSGYVGVGAGGWNVYTESDGTTSYDDRDGDGVYDMDEIRGCTDATANNHAPNATDDDDSCDFDLDDDGVLDADEVPGCTNATASNYNSLATDDDGSCELMTAEVFYLQILSLFVNGGGPMDEDGVVPIENLHAVVELLQSDDVFYMIGFNFSVDDFVNYSTCEAIDNTPVFCPWGENLGDYSVNDLERDYGDNLTCLSKEEVGLIPGEGAELVSLLESTDMGAYTYGDSEFLCLTSHPDTWDDDDDSGPDWFWDDIAVMIVSDAFGHWEIVLWGGD